MTDTTHITLDKLLPWDGNVRKTGASEALAELTASIAAHGLLQGLVVKPTSGKKNAGKYHVVAGQRRLMALTALAERGTIANDHPVRCHVIAHDAQAEEISLAENTVRLQMHPIDQFEAFNGLVEKGTPVPDIAARFGVAESTVQKLLKLARVSPKILAAYRAGELNLAQVQAFASTDDQDRQEAVFEDINPEYADPDDIRDALTPEGDVPDTDKRAVYVGIEAYVKAGGKTRSDLFTNSTFLLDAELLNELAAKKLAKSEKKIRTEGWAWVEIAPDLSWETRNKYGRIHEEPAPLSPELQAEYDALKAERDLLEAAQWNETADENPERLTEIEARIEELDDRESSYIPEQMAIAGCFITIDREGEIDILRGLVKPEDRPRIAALTKAQQSGDRQAVQDALTAAKNAAPQPKGMPASLIEDLTKHRTAALSAALAQSPDIALAATVYTLAIETFRQDYQGSASCIELSGNPKHRFDHPKETLAERDLQNEETIVRDRIPADADTIWQWCMEQDSHTLLQMLAFTVAQSVNAVRRKADTPDSNRLQHADLLAKTLKLDMSLYFRPDAGNYFGRISKDMILADIRDMTGKDPSPAQAKMKKSELAATAAKLVQGTNWLPAMLRPQAAPQS
jgi:ParB family chromosome partitioning protein